LPESTAGRQPQFETKAAPEISEKNYMSAKISGLVARIALSGGS
jgi:hypothetical protein